MDKHTKTIGFLGLWCYLLLSFLKEKIIWPPDKPAGIAQFKVEGVIKKTTSEGLQNKTPKQDIVLLLIIKPKELQVVSAKYN